MKQASSTEQPKNTSAASPVDALIPRRFHTNTLFEPTTLATEVVGINLGELQRDFPSHPRLRGPIGPNCLLWTSPALKQSFLAGKGNVYIRSVGSKAPQNACFIVLSDDIDLRLMFRQSDAMFILGAGANGNLDVRLNDKAPLAVIGDGLVTRGLRLAAHGREVIIGAGCLIGEETIIQGHDAHGIVDIASGRLLNRSDQVTELAPHVWLSKRVMVMPGRKIGKGTIIGAASVVTRDIPAFSLAVGAPARVVRCGVTWSRSRNVVDSAATKFISELTSDERSVDNVKISVANHIGYITTNAPKSAVFTIRRIRGAVIRRLSRYWRLCRVKK